MRNLKLVFIILLVYYVSYFFFSLASSYGTYRVIGSESVTYPLLWVKNLYIALQPVFVFPATFLVGGGGFGAIGRGVFIILLRDVLLLGVIVALAIKIFRGTTHFKSVLTVMVILLLLFNPVTHELYYYAGLRHSRHLSVSASTEYRVIENAFENNNITFDLVSSELIDVVASPYFAGQDMYIFEITMTMEQMPAELPHVWLSFNEGDFDMYQIYRHGETTSTIKIIQHNGRLEFIDDESGAMLSTGNSNEMQFRLGVNLRQDTVNEIEIKPRLDVYFDDPLDYRRHNERISVSSPNLIKTDYKPLVIY